MTTAATSLLGLALPVTGELAGTWGTTVNDSITSLLDTAVAGTTTLSTDADVTLSTTTLAANQARQAILLCSGARTALRTITAPAQSKIYTIINATTGGFSVKLVGVGPTTGLTIPNGASAVVAWNGSDFIEIGSSTVGNLTVNGNLTVTGTTTLSAGTANGVAYLNGSKVVTTGSALTFNGTIFAAPRVRLNDANRLDWGDSGEWIVGDNGGAMLFGVDAAEQMRLTSTGLGIGTSSPVAKLDVKKTSSDTISRTNAVGGFGDWDSLGAGLLMQQTLSSPYGFALQAANAANSVQFPLLLNPSGGNVGIGTSSPTVNLHVYNASSAEIRTASANIGLQLYSSEGAGTSVIGTYTNHALVFRTNATERARITSGGDFVVNGTATLNTNAKLSVWNGSAAGSASGIATGYSTTNGQFRLIYLNSTADALNFDNGNNNATLTSGGTWTNASDARLKKNIQPIKYGLETVLASQPKSFNRVDVDGEYIGFIAQELQTQIPEVVYGNEDTKYSVDYGSLVAVAFKAIQEQQALITALTARVAALEAK